MAALRRAKWVLAQVGRKPGAETAISVLPETGDLPGSGWKQLDQRTWRSGEVEPDSRWALRAREIGSVTAWRSFEDAAGSRWVWCQVTPLASAADAEDALGILPEKMLKNLRAEVRVVRSRDLDPPALPHASRVWAHEQETEGPTGPGVARFLAAAAGPIVIVTCATGSAWDWEMVEALTRLQIKRGTALPPTR